jgi:hypothetical protein
MRYVNNHDNKHDSESDILPLEIKQNLPLHGKNAHQEVQRFVTPEKLKIQDNPEKLKIQDNHEFKHHMVNTILFNTSELQSKDAITHQVKRTHVTPKTKQEIQSKNTIAQQIKRAQLTPDKKQEIQSKNTIAQQIKRAQLTPDKKQEIQCKNTIAQQIKRAQLPLERKQEIQCKDTRAHQEKRAQLPLERKQEIQSKDTIAHQENRAHLPFERKQEIQSKDTIAHQEKRGYDTDQLELLCNDIIWQTEVDAAILECVRKHYTKHPNLALFYYYCCSTNPDSQIRNNEFSSEISRNRVWNRISNAVGPPIGQQEAILCQNKTEKIACSNNKISFCASCCERIVQDQDKNVIIETHIDKLHKSFLLTEEQAKQMHLLKRQVLEAHVMVLQHNDKLYHLNPDLVVDKEKIILCQICENDPLDHDFSIANGHDYGRRGSLPSLNTTTQNAIIPFRCFNINIKLMANHSTGHSIVFPCDGPVETAKVLPYKHG